MADDYLFYEEDYEDLSDWDETSDHNINNKEVKSVSNKESKEEECVKEIKNGIKTLKPIGSPSPSSLASPYISKTTSSRFIVHEYWVLTSSQMSSHLDNLISSISSTLNISFSVVSLLLRIYSWNTERLMENYLLDSVSCIRDNNLHLISESSAKLCGGNEEEIFCAICVSDIKMCDTLSLECNHRFCNECWSEYIHNAMNNQSFNCILLSCPSHKCNTPLSSSIIKRFCLDDEEYNKYCQYMLSSYICNTKNKYKFCPSPGCKYIIYCNISDMRMRDCSVLVQCRCGYDVCFLCLEEYHAPATCSQIQNWNEKCGAESDNAQWIVTNTKKCPKCFTRIERNHGCNHMVCTKCKHEFCWVCIGSWKQHGIGTGGYYRCNKYKPKATMGNKNKLKQKDNQELDKFVHYFNRFHNHAQSRQFLIRSSNKVLRKIKAHFNAKRNDDNEKKKDKKSWIDVEFLQKAHDEIFFCRQILKYTYVYAYYLKSGAEKDLFEFLQQDLEKNCEILHELCEQNWKNINATHIINYTNITHRFVKQLLHGIAKGLTS